MHSVHELPHILCLAKEISFLRTHSLMKLLFEDVWKSLLWWGLLTKIRNIMIFLTTSLKWQTFLSYIPKDVNTKYLVGVYKLSMKSRLSCALIDTSKSLQTLVKEIFELNISWTKIKSNFTEWSILTAEKLPLCQIYRNLEINYKNCQLIVDYCWFMRHFCKMSIWQPTAKTVCLSRNAE